MRLHAGKWLVVGVHLGDQRVRAEPFEAIELDLTLLWADVEPPSGSRASEPGAEYDYDY